MRGGSVWYHLQPHNLLPSSDDDQNGDGSDEDHNDGDDGPGNGGRDEAAGPTEHQVALNSSEAEEQGKQDVSGLSEDIVMEDASHVEPAQEVLASLSSTLEPPSLGASGDSVLHAPEAPELAEPSSSSRFVGPKVHHTPDVLEELFPSRDFSLTLDENAWRFRVECKVKGQVFVHPYQNKTLSRAFNGSSVKWQSALEECHKYMWEKWDLVKKKAPMLSSERQEPGHVKPDVFDGLQHKMDNQLTAKKNYGSKK